MQFAAKVIIAAVPFFAGGGDLREHCRSSEAQKLCGWNNGWVSGMSLGVKQDILRPPRLPTASPVQIRRRDR
jgi:hypothetical protein